MITKYLPKFKSMEVNNLTGLRSGHMLSQFKANSSIAKKAVGDVNFIENGILVGLDSDGTINNFDKTKHGVMFVHYTEELNTVLDELQYFAVEIEDGVAYPRCIALYVGDTFTTDNYTGTYEGAKFAKVTNGVLDLQTAADADTAFIVGLTTMPNGSKAVEATFYRMPTQAE